MDLNYITDDFAVSGQLMFKDITLVSAMGFHTIICNRPNGEDPFQELFAQIAAECEQSGLTAVYIPVPQSGPTGQNIDDFAKAFEVARKPVLAYSATGARSRDLFAAAAQQYKDS